MVHSLTGALVLTILAAARVFATGDGTLAAPIRIPLRSPVAVATGDFDGDGRAELVTAAFESKISILWRVGGDITRWEVKPGPVVGNNSFFVRAADFTQDGKDDLVVCDLTVAGFAHVFKSRGDASFEATAVLREALGPRWVTVADFNADGHLDLATANVQTHTFSVFLGLGDGTFTHVGTRRRTDGSPHSIEALDLDGDGSLDLCSGMTSVGILPLRGDGKGEFTPLDVFTNLGGVRYLSTGDFNRDGRGDLATSVGLAGISRGDATFEVTLSSDLPVSITFPSIADFDGDGLEDVVFSQSDVVAFCRGDGDGTFQPIISSDYVSQFPYFAATRDLDGDARSDLVSVDLDAATATIFRGASSASGFEIEPRFLHSPVTAAACFDVIGDDAPDLILASLVSPSLHVFTHPERKLKDSRPDLELPLTDLLATLEPVDLNSDGRMDLAGTVFGGDQVLVAVLDPSGRIAGIDSLPTGKSPGAALPARLWSDEAPDLVVPCQGSSRIDILVGKGGVAFQPAESVSSITFPRAVATADLDADSRLDLVVAGAAQVAAHLAKSDGSFGGLMAISENASRDYTGVEAGDWNRDGMVDLAILDSKQGLVLLRQGHGQGEFSGERLVNQTEGLSRIALADLDEDGAPELLAASGPGGNLVVIGNLEVDPAPPAARYQSVKGAVSICTGDLNLDGALDVIVTENAETAILPGQPGRIPARTFRRADISANGRVELTDALQTLLWLFQGGGAPGCEDAADSNDDGKVDLADAVGTLRWLFQGAAEPPSPGPRECGVDPTLDDLRDCTDDC